MMPEAPEGCKWEVEMTEYDLIVRLTEYVTFPYNGSQCRQKVTHASVSQRMVEFGRDYFATTGTATAVKLAERILRKLETQNKMSQELGVEVEMR